MKQCAIYVLFFFLFTSVARDARSDRLEGLPAGDAAAGDAFVNAWLVFRENIDALFGLKVHPEQYAAWIEQMPPFLLRDAARVATNHDVLLDVTARLARIGGKQNQALLREVREIYAHTAIAPLLTMRLIRSGDRRAEANALKGLNHRVRSRRLEAAIVLSGAGHAKGFDYLKTVFRKQPQEQAIAGVTLGRFGGVSEAKFIDGALKRAPRSTALQVAKGEVLLKDRFPYHYRRLSARYLPLRTVSEEGIYETWLTTIARAFDFGTGGSRELLQTINQLRRSPPDGRNPELVKRQLAALYDFWSAVDDNLNKGVRTPPPHTFGDAMRVIQRSRERKEDADGYVASKMTAAIAVLAALGERLGYPAVAAPTTGVHAISPLGERALDGNLATSWPVKAGSRMVLEHARPLTIDSLLFMAACSHRTGKVPIQLRVTGVDPRRNAWQKQLTLPAKTTYFQRLLIRKASRKRISIDVIGIKGRSLSCIAEIRVIGAATKK